jgi:hypothetical protein
MNLQVDRRARQPIREPWSRERLIHERSIALANALDSSTQVTYNSHLQSYLNFCKIHNFPTDPTADTLSFFIVYMSKHINPRSLPGYLSGIISRLEPIFPQARENAKKPIVRRTLQGCKRLNPKAIARKRALDYGDLRKLLDTLSPQSSYDDLLFVVLVLTGFYALMRLGELVVPDQLAKRNVSKIILRSSLKINDDRYQFLLPAHKADRFFEGNTILIQSTNSAPNAVPIMQRYIRQRDVLFPHHPQLFLQSDGTVPARGFFMRRIKRALAGDVGGHSMRSGGATALAIAGVPDNRIQAMGRWSSDAYQQYIRKHPALLQALTTGRAIFDRPP